MIGIIAITAIGLCAMAAGCMLATWYEDRREARLDTEHAQQRQDAAQTRCAHCGVVCPPDGYGPSWCGRCE